MSKRQLLKVKRRLPTGAISRIAEEKGISQALVSKVLAGYREDHHGILQAAANEANRATEERKIKTAERKRILKSVI